MTPAARQTARVGAGAELSHKVMANGSLFVLKGGAPQAGSVAYGPLRLMHTIAEAAADGGVQTKDLGLAEALRGLNIYNETKL